MSVSPLPVHMSCYGVSSDAVNLARGYHRNSYADRIATVKSTMLTSACQESGSMAPSNNVSCPSAGNGSRPAAQASPTRQSPQVKLQPLRAEQAQQIFGGGGGGSGASGCGSTSTGTPNSLRYRAHTKHVKTVAPTLQALDFISIAVNSVGGGGVPRPYGKFQACRSGDGNATWERLPPPPGSWQARALPIAVTLLGDSPPPAGPPKPDSPTSAGSGPRPQRSGGESTRSRTSTRGPEGSDTSPAASASTSPRRLPHAATSDGAGHVSRVGGDATRLRLSFTPSEAGGDYSRGPGDEGKSYGQGRSRSQPNPDGASPRGAGRGGGGGHAREGPPNAHGAAAAPGGGLHEQSYYRRPGSSLHRSLVPLPPPEPHNLGAWFALPAATFLADVPHVPEQLRMDNGYSVSRQFLMSGLNPPRRPPPPASPPRSPTFSQRQQQQQQQQQQQGVGYPQSQQQPHLLPGPGHAPSLPQTFQPLQSLQRPGDGAGAGGYLHHPHHSQPPLELRPEDSLALWNALEGSQAAAAAAAAMAQHQQQYHSGGGASSGGGGAGGMLRGVYVPLEKRPAPDPAAATSAAVSVEPSPRAAGLRGSLQLPPEVTLPRRAEPAGW